MAPSPRLPRIRRQISSGRFSRPAAPRSAFRSSRIQRSVVARTAQLRPYPGPRYAAPSPWPSPNPRNNPPRSGPAAHHGATIGRLFDQRVAYPRVHARTPLVHAHSEYAQPPGCGSLSASSRSPGDQCARIGEQPDSVSRGKSVTRLSPGVGCPSTAGTNNRRSTRQHLHHHRYRWDCTSSFAIRVTSARAVRNVVTPHKLVLSAWPASLARLVAATP